MPAVNIRVIRVIRGAHFGLGEAATRVPRIRPTTSKHFDRGDTDSSGHEGMRPIFGAAEEGC
jgi:hypothetical protein